MSGIRELPKRSQDSTVEKMSAFGIPIDGRCVRFFPAGVSKADVLDEMVNAAAATGHVSDIEALRGAVLAREMVMSTGIGGGVAIPHVRIDGVSEPVIALGLSRDGIDFDSIDGEPVRIVVLFAMPRSANEQYLRALARTMLTLKTAGLVDQLPACTTPEQVVELLNESK
jgi:mannitol/fructose-specific phosphotransferase system IIA component (Ntr-type)